MIVVHAINPVVVQVLAVLVVSEVAAVPVYIAELDA